MEEFREILKNKTVEEINEIKNSLVKELLELEEDVDYLRTSAIKNPKYSDVYEDIKYDRERIEKIKEKLTIINTFNPKVM